MTSGSPFLLLSLTLHWTEQWDHKWLEEGITWGSCFRSMQRNVPAHIQYFRSPGRENHFYPVQLVVALYSYRTHSEICPPPNTSSILYPTSSDMSTTFTIAQLKCNWITESHKANILSWVSTFQTRTLDHWHNYRRFVHPPPPPPPQMFSKNTEQL